MSDMDDDELKATRKLNGADRSEADEMFKKLGYRKFDNHPEHDLPPEPNMWSTQDCRVIEYTDEAIIDGKHCLQRISFEILSEKVLCEAFLNNRRIGFIPFNAKEIKAMYLKCKEKGWID